jgi:hypothetical protein
VRIGVDAGLFFKVSESGRMESLKGVLVFSEAAGELVLRDFET